MILQFVHCTYYNLMFHMLQIQCIEALYGNYRQQHIQYGSHIEIQDGRHYRRCCIVGS